MKNGFAVAKGKRIITVLNLKSIDLLFTSITEKTIL